MIDITLMDQKCFAMVSGRCTILTSTDCGNCKFYKPKDCEDWVRLELHDRIVVVEPEEYAKLKGV
jgi:hypothetical protein